MGPPRASGPSPHSEAGARVLCGRNSFATPFLVPPSHVLTRLEATGRVASDGHAAEESKLKADMRCPIDGRALSNMPAVKRRVAETSYREGVRRLADGADLVLRWPGAGA